MNSRYTKTTNSLLRLARNDLLAAEVLLEKRLKELYPQVGFHCQQSVEKSIKGFLCYKQVTYKHVHNLESFRDPLIAQFPQIKSEYQKSLRLIPFAVKFRYEDLDLETISIKEMKTLFSNANKINKLILREIVKIEKKKKSSEYLNDWSIFAD